MANGGAVPLLKDDSLLEFVAYNDDASVRLRLAAETQQRYRESARGWGVQLWRAEQVEACCRRLGEDGEPLERPVTGAATI